jgi:leader peptidase (prepilin peptidase) / N-methyltransferase
MRSLLILPLDLVALLFCFTVGASVGSFLNVVVYRSPRGLNLAYPPSRCPVCLTPIKPWNNLPILSWLFLRGRCADCKAPFSARYFLVELATALMFAVLFWMEVRSSGANLPEVRLDSMHGVLPWSYDHLLMGKYAYHAVLLSYLLSVTLIRWDLQQVPLRLTLYGVLLGLLPVLIWPALHPVAFREDEWIGPGEGFVQAVFGLAGGAIVGLLLRSCSSASALISTAAIVGLFLGWQAALSVGCLAALGMFLVSIASRVFLPAKRLPAVVCLSIAAAAQLFFWSTLTTFPSWPGPYSSVAIQLLSAVAVAVVAFVAHQIRKDHPFA